MKSQNPTGTPDPAIAPAPSATGQGNYKTNNKRLKLTLEAEHPGVAVVLHCQGRIIFHREASALSTIVTEVLPSARRMVVDLAGVDSVDSGGVGQLVLAHVWADAAGYTLKFACTKKSVRHLFEVTNLLSVFDVYASVPEAMAAMYPEEVPSA